MTPAWAAISIKRLDAAVRGWVAQHSPVLEDFAAQTGWGWDQNLAERGPYSQGKAAAVDYASQGQGVDLQGVRAPPLPILLFLLEGLRFPLGRRWEWPCLDLRLLYRQDTCGNGFVFEAIDRDMASNRGGRTVLLQVQKQAAETRKVMSVWGWERVLRGEILENEAAREVRLNSRMG